ncbi:NADP transhydrogenase subunit alpha [bacterium]|jgi:predicted NAD/FAD-binding protein|nr:NADP transhydrogenase subunit alpha [bacterium]
MRTAIIGTGIAGLGTAHFLHRAGDEVTCFGPEAYPGGHSNTVEAVEPGTGRALPIDTGFMVFNRVTYPQLCRLFEELKVPVKPTDMSFAVKDLDTGLEWCGSSLNHLFAQRKNLLSPRFIRMLLAVKRFNEEAVAALKAAEAGGAPITESLADYVRRRGYGKDFWDLYLVPMSSAVWSTPPEKMMAFPAASLLRFFHNHGFLGLDTQHPWWTVDGGSREYVRRLVAPFADRLRLGCAVSRVVRHGPGRGVTVFTADGAAHAFDRAVVAAHADDALRLLVNPTADEIRLLGAFKYQTNVATLHTDANVMPRARLAWASWVYQISRDRAGRITPATHYWMNRLQGVSERERYFVSINRPEQIDPAKVIKTIDYTHPLFDLGALAAQGELPALNAAARGATETYFAGSYFRYGFHEDAFLSAVQLSEFLLGRDPWA